MRGKPANPHLISNSDDPSKAIESARERHCAWLIFDTAAGDIDQIDRAIITRDLCLIPVSACAFDLVAARTVVALGGGHDKQFAFASTARTRAAGY